MLNQVALVCRIVEQPKLSYTKSGKAVTNLRVANNRKFGENEESSFFRVVVWDKQAEVCCKTLSTGDLVSVSGRLRSRVYDDNNGQKREVVEIVSDDVRFLKVKVWEKKDSEKEVSKPEPKSKEDYDNIPF